MYTNIMLDCLIADALTALKRKQINVEQFDKRVKSLKEMKVETNKELQSEYIDAIHDQELEIQREMRRGEF